MQPNRLQQAITRGLPTRSSKRPAPGSGRDPGGPVGAVQAGEQTHGLERVVERAEKPGACWAGALGPVYLEAGNGGAADGDEEAEGRRAEAAESVHGDGEADREAVGEEERLVFQLEEARDFRIQGE